MPTVMIAAFIDKMPVFDPQWPDELQVAWMGIACVLMREIRHQLCCDVAALNL